MINPLGDGQSRQDALGPFQGICAPLDARNEHAPGKALYGVRLDPSGVNLLTSSLGGRVTKKYPTLVKQTEHGERIRIITITDLIEGKGFYVLVQDRLRTSSSIMPVDSGPPSRMLFKTYPEAEIEANKNLADSIAQGFRDDRETY